MAGLTDSRHPGRETTTESSEKLYTISSPVRTIPLEA